MTIKSHDENGFVLSTAKFGNELAEVRIDYAKLSEAQKLWAIRNGLSQAMTDSHAADTEVQHLTKEKATAAAQLSVEAWAKNILIGHVPSTGVGRARISSEERATREVTADWLVAGGMKVGQARKLVATEGCEEIVMRLATEKAAKIGGDATAMYEKRWNAIQNAVEKILAAKAPEVDGEF